MRNNHTAIDLAVWNELPIIQLVENNNNMKLHEIIKANEHHTSAILIELLIPYKRSLLTYYRDLFCSEPMLMVTDVMNVCQYAKIVPANEFNEAVYAYMGVDYVDEEDTESDDFAQHETINFNSMPLSKL